MSKSPFEQAIERATGRTVEQLRDTPIDERRREIEALHGAPMRVTNGDGLLIARAQIEKLLDKLL